MSDIYEAAVKNELRLQSRGSKVRTHDDSLAAIKDCVLNLPLCGRFFHITDQYRKAVPAQQKKREFGGSLSMPERYHMSPPDLRVWRVFLCVFSMP